MILVPVLLIPLIIIIKTMELTRFIDGAAILSAKGVICDYCFKVMNDPRLVLAESNLGVQCSHQMCFTCSVEILKGGICAPHGNKISQVVENQSAKLMMKELKMRCARYELGCRVFEVLGEGHLCDFEPKTCKFCDKVVFRVDFERHLEVCEEAKISCPLEFTGCQCQMMKKKDLKANFDKLAKKHLELLLRIYLSTVEFADPQRGIEIQSQFDSLFDSENENENDKKLWKYKLRRGMRVDVYCNGSWNQGIVMKWEFGEVLVHLIGNSTDSDS